MTDTRPQVQEAQLSKIITNHLLSIQHSLPPAKVYHSKITEDQDNKKILKDTGWGGGVGVE